MVKTKGKQNIATILTDIVQFKASCEANIIGCLWKQPDLYDTYDSLNVEDFSKEIWKLFFGVGKEIYQGENKKVLDDITTGLYLEKHKKVKAKYIEFGGYKTIEELKSFVQIGNAEGYIIELEKWSKVLDLHKMGFPIDRIIGKIKDISLEDLYDYYEAQLNHVFMSTASGASQSHNLLEGLHEMIDDCNKGLDVGFPIRPEMLNEEINGMSKGNITLLGAQSGAGKTTSAIEWILPNMVKHNEQVVMVINEQDEVKVRQELIVWVANNQFNANFNKKRMRQGKFSKKEMDVLRKSADYLEDKKDNRNIVVIPLQTYTVEAMIKILKKYSALGVDYFILDTFKESDDARDEAYLSMMRDMRKLYDVVKPASKNVHLFVTVQLTKGMGNKYLSNGNIGMSKNIVDVCSTVLLMRRVREDEKDEKGLRVYKMGGKNGRSKIPVTLEEDKDYVIIFISKNRFGSSGSYQIVAEFDMGKNMYEEIGITVMQEDY